MIYRWARLCGGQRSASLRVCSSAPTTATDATSEISWTSELRRSRHSTCLHSALQSRTPTTRVARFSTTKYGRFLSVDPSKSSPPNVSIYNSAHVAIRTQIPHKQWTLLNFDRTKIESSPSLCLASLIRLSTWHCPHLQLSAVLWPRAAALLLPGALRCRSISFARTALSSKPAARRYCVWLMGQTDWWTDRRTDTGPFYRPCFAYYAHSVKKRVQLTNRRCSAPVNFMRRHMFFCYY